MVLNFIISSENEKSSSEGRHECIGERVLKCWPLRWLRFNTGLSKPPLFFRGGINGEKVEGKQRKY